MIGTSEISNRPVARPIKVIHNNLSSFISILLSSCINLDSIMYVSMRSTHTVCHGVKVSESLAQSNLYLALRLLNFRQYLQVLQSLRAWSTIPDHLQLVFND